MKNKSPTTPKSYIMHALRMLWLRSRERATALRLAGYCCKSCGKKKTQKKGEEVNIEVHHIDGIKNWDKIINVIREEMLCDIDKLEVLCKECHDKKTYGV